MTAGGTSARRVLFTIAAALIAAPLAFLFCSQAFAANRLTSSGIKQAAMEVKKLESVTATAKSAKLKGKPWISKSGTRGKYSLKATFSNGFCIMDYDIRYLNNGTIRITWRGSQAHGGKSWCTARVKTIEMPASSMGM